MKLYLDDTRKCPVGWTLARNYDEAIKFLATGRVTEASLDHDLAPEHYMDEPTSEKTGYDVVCWMEENNVWPVDGVSVHSMNPAGAWRMRQVISKHYSGGANGCEEGQEGS